MTIKKKSYLIPSISCVMATFNSSESIKECLESLFSQNYPADKIEVLIADGGSTDSTLDILKKFKISLYNVPKDKQEAEYNKGVALSHAKNEIILFIDHDNVLPHKNWLKKMVEPLVEHEEIAGCEVLRFNYNPKDNILDRYFALTGCIDPVPYYLGKDSKLSWAYDTYNLFGKSKDCGNYFMVTFVDDNIPTMGANGTMLRRNLLRYTQSDPVNFFHIDIFYDLVKKGFKSYAFVKDDIIHLKRTKISYFVNFLLRRKKIMERQYFDNLKRRRYAVFIPKKDTLKLILFILYTLTIVKPVYDALKGYLKIHDIAWFLHPLICLGFLITYGWAIISRQVKKMMI